ncbi:LytTR family DNA-binding domain-containing protein [Bengtsoniella intestinalis]|uniref:LytR/AlgR family response regulator transcription factor n=1 Tax=Bengtsoniella intestinalis TaxID=3073143 RepID=UPI00391F896E
METLRIAICEDDPQDLQHLLDILDQSQYPMVVSTFTSGRVFWAQFHPNQYDLLLMDIFTDDITGIDVVTKVRTTDPDVPVAFTSSSQAFTRESYRLDALKYIEKPASAKAIIEMLQLTQLKQQTVEQLVLRTATGAMTYPTSQIIYLEQTGRKLTLHFSSGEQVTVTKKLDEIADQLAGKHFLRCHKSYLVNLAFVCGIDCTLSTFSTTQGDTVHIRRESFWQAKKAFETYLFTKGQAVTHA